ncbi:hypothetical protein M0813_06892 [Anaeramoeba flamelloides]|uniref:Uncharacterized protein n=1 Tax=Anaeramoeba flamelloides TaxID=1746091 RepID=A0ABQ8XDW0_9EUKA|nr:hypothetical protein M0813_06892 [Anaeramoeba flamelloides]
MEQAYEFIPTFDNPKYYIDGYNVNDFMRGVRELLAPKSQLYISTLEAMGYGETWEALIPKSLEFVNYGRRQLIFRVILATKDSERVTFIASIGQKPEFAELVKEEYENLTKLYSNFPELTLKMYSFNEIEVSGIGKFSAFTVEDQNMCRCIYRDRRRSDSKWGIYNPEPYYHLEEFPEYLQRETILLCIANLVACYLHKEGLGIGHTRISGSDYILLKEFRYKNKQPKEATKSLRENWRLSAARKLIKIPFEEYLDLIRSEFLIKTTLKSESVLNGKIKINHKSTMAFDSQIIEEGIKLGLNGWK